jgi:glycosyltransferase involved in cell wall biosynthesis
MTTPNGTRETPPNTERPGGGCVSVIIPTRNRSHLLADALGSVLHQSWRDVQVLVIDDASDEAHWRDVQRLAASAASVQLLRHPVQRGVSAARNLGLSLATGDYILFLDDDDLLDRDALMRSVAILEADRTWDGVVCGVRFESLPGASGAGQAEPQREEPRVHSIATCIAHTFAIHSALVRRQAIGDLRFPEDATMAEDQYFWCRVFQTGCRFVSRPERDAIYRRHASNVTNSLSESRRGTRLYYLTLLRQGMVHRPDDLALIHLRIAYWSWHLGYPDWVRHAALAACSPVRSLRHLRQHVSRQRKRVSTEDVYRADTRVSLE